MTRRCRVVIDTNVIVSFFLRHGSTPWRAVRHAIEHDELVISEAILAELDEVLRRPRFDRYVSRELREQFLATLPRFATMVPIVQSVRACDDPSDDRFLEAAVNGRARFLVTGDRALLAMKIFRDVEIVTPSAYPAFLTRLVGTSRKRRIPATCRISSNNSVFGRPARPCHRTRGHALPDLKSAAGREKCGLPPRQIAGALTGPGRLTCTRSESAARGRSAFQGWSRKREE